jgi:hypothetical protein
VREAITLIWRLSVLAELAVAIRLLMQGLGGEYPALLTACCVLPIKSVLLMFVFSFHVAEHGRQLARNLDPVEWAVSAWVVFELFSKWTRSYRGIGRFGKILLTTLLVGALLVSVACWRIEWHALVFASNFRIYYILNRIVLGTLALFVLGTWIFFRNYPVAIAPNVVRHTHIAVIYFVANGLAQLTFTLNGLKYVTQVNLAIVIATTGCFCAWAVLLTKKGQVAPPIQQVSLEDRERIERVNQELLVFMRAFPKTTAKPTALRPVPRKSGR